MRLYSVSEPPIYGTHESLVTGSAMAEVRLAFLLRLISFCDDM